MIVKMLSLNNIFVILNILKLKYINYGIVYQCENDYNSSLIQKMFNEKQIFVTFQQINLKLDHHFAKSKHGFIIDSDCENWDRVLSTASFKVPNTWIVIGSNFTNTVATLSQYPIEIDSDVHILLKNQYDLYEIFNTGFYTRGKIIVNHLGYIDSKVTNITRKPRLGGVLGGVTLKCPIVVTENVVNETYLHFIDRWRPPARDAVHKFKFYRILTYLQTMYRFEYDFVRTKSWGYLRNGSFDGMVGELQQGRGDVGGSGVFFRSDRTQFIQYVVDVWKVRPCFIFRHPKYPGGFYSVFTRPLSTTVWGCLVLLLVVAAALMAAMLRVSAFDDTSLSLMFVFVSGAVGQQGMPIYSQSSAIKILIFSTLIFTLTLYQYYNATVVSTLLREPPTTIRTLEDLLHSKMDIGIEDTLYDRDYFRRTTDPIAIKLYRTKIDTPKRRNIFPAEVGMRLVRAGGFAFHLESVAGYQLMRGGFGEREICEAQEVALYPPQRVGVVVKKGSPYREFFAVGIHKMHESGIMVRLNSAWEESKPACVRTPVTSAISVTITDFSMALVVVAVGMVLAVIALVGEMVVFRLSRRY